MTQYGRTRQSLAKHSLAPKKRFGQNFLVNHHTAQAIVHAGRIAKTDTVVEVGVGLGALTLPLAEAADRVIGVEIDSGIIRFHEEEQDLPDNVTLIHLDILKADFTTLYEQCGGMLKLMANLPYSISNPFIFKLIENREYVHSATIMLQKEVAERLMAQPGTKEYGVPSVLLQSCASLQKMLTLKPAEFHPRPKIDSVVLRIEFHHTDTPPNQQAAYDFSSLQKVVRATFHQRRKTILNTLGNLVAVDHEGRLDKVMTRNIAERVIAEAGLLPTDRPETLSLADFIRLAIAWEKHCRS